jgi:hypothetical protein
VKLDHSSDILLDVATTPIPRRVDLRMAQAPVNAPDYGENITADLKLVVMEETMKVLEGVQLKVILYVSFIERECRNVGSVPGL